MSYSTQDEKYAEWIASTVDNLGYSVTIQCWDFHTGSNFVIEMNKALMTSEKLLLVLSENALSSGFVEAEWTNFLARDPTGSLRKILPVKIDGCKPNGLLKTIVYCDVENLSEEQTREKIANAIKGNQGCAPRGQSVKFPGQIKKGLSTKRLQVALDIQDITKAEEIRNLCEELSVDVLEVGDPLVQACGQNVISRLKSPAYELVAELAPSDWIESQIATYADLGADTIQVIGILDLRRVESSVRVARSKNVKIIICLFPHMVTLEWVETLVDAGVDEIGIIRSIDTATEASEIFEALDRIRKVTDIPVRISGGFTPATLKDNIKESWSTVIVGGSIVHSPSPSQIIKKFQKLIENEN